ncbi:MAG TPA: tol-pal system protein YbgF [Burkholderiaceae bacterium]|nr:tol-pal system protein YbgF [Burkholderiaceae bacterium]
MSAAVTFPEASRRPRAFAAVRRACALAALLVAGTSAHAGLFDDDEARRAIIDLRTRISQLEDAGKSQNTQQQQQIQQLQNALLDLTNQNEQLRQQMAQLRGQNEQLAKDLSDVQRQQKNIAQGVDDRLRKVEPQQVNLDGKTFAADPEEVQSYEAATGTLRSGDFDKATVALNNFLRRWPGSGYADLARYWLGNAQYGNRDFKGAIVTFKAFITAAPTHARAPEAELAIANCQIELKDVRGAKATLNELLKTYPKSEAAAAGRDRLKSLK